ncbi:MAG: hypothetical protein U1A72_12245 [Sulfuritalea sp.]|nr:hypothetical protein [Sulfuritalea sp.]
MSKPRLLISKREKHQEISLELRGRKIKVDSGVKELILLLNSIHGVETLFSCQGSFDDGGGNKGYVMLAGPKSVDLLPRLALAIAKQTRIWWQHNNPMIQGCRSMTVELEVSQNGIVIRWMHWDYERLLGMVRSLFEHDAKESASCTGAPSTLAGKTPH